MAVRIRSVEERLGDPAWRRPHRWPLLLVVATLGCFSFLWFAWHAQSRGTDRRLAYEVWAVVWALVGFASYRLGAGLDVSTTTAAGLSFLVWLVRVLSVVHVRVEHERLLRSLAAAEVRRETAMVLEASATLAPGRQVRFAQPAGDPFAVPDPPAGGTGPGAGAPGPRDPGLPGLPGVAGPVLAGPGPAAGGPGHRVRSGRGRTWGKPGQGAPEPSQGRRLESPAEKPAESPWMSGGAPAARRTGASPTEAAPVAGPRPGWEPDGVAFEVPGLVPDPPPEDPAPRGRVLDL